MSYIELKNIHKIYNPGTSAEVHALRGINLQIEKGELAAVMGPSGSGKSTMLHILGCIDTPSEGTYILDGKEVSTMSDNELAKIRNKRIGFVLQEFGLIGDQTVLENVSIPLMFSDIKYRDIKGKALNILKAIDIDSLAYKSANQLSGGQKQRVAIARSLVNDPDVILADEPTGALDQATSDEIMDILSALNNQGRTIVIVTHNADIAKRCHRIVRIMDGIIEEEAISV